MRESERLTADMQEIEKDYIPAGVRVRVISAGDLPEAIGRTGITRNVGNPEDSEVVKVVYDETVITAADTKYPHYYYWAEEGREIVRV